MSCHVTRHITDASGTEWCLLYSIMFGPRPNIWYNSKWSHIPTASLWKHATAFKVFVCHHDCAVMLSHAVYWCCKSFKYACCHLALASAFEFERLLPSAPTFSAYRSMMLQVLYIGCHGQNTNLPLHALKQIEILIDVAKAKLIARRDVQYLAALTNQCDLECARDLCFDFWSWVHFAFLPHSPVLSMRDEFCCNASISYQAFLFPFCIAASTLCWPHFFPIGCHRACLHYDLKWPQRLNFCNVADVAKSLEEFFGKVTWDFNLMTQMKPNVYQHYPRTV